MAQLSYSSSLTEKVVGNFADGNDSKVATKICSGNVPVGRGVVKMYGVAKGVRLPQVTKCVILNSGGTFTAGNIVTAVTVTTPNAAATTSTITTAFDTDKNTSMTAHAAAILAGVAGLLSCAYDSSGHTITLTSKNDTLSGVATTPGTGTMTITSYTYTSADTAAMFNGVLLNDGTIEQTSAGVVQREEGEVCNVVYDGSMVVYAEEAVSPDSSVYLRTKTNSAKLPGYFGVTSTSGETVVLTGVKWGSSTSAAGPATLVLNLPA